MDFTTATITLFYTLICLQNFQAIEAAPFVVLGPEGPVAATVVGDALLTCRLSPGLSAQGMEIRWYRKHSDSIVLLYRKGTEHEDHQLPEYQGRTQLLTHAIANGSVILRIHPVRVTDEGEYRCYFNSDTYHDEAALELMVTGFNSDPDIRLEGYHDGGIRVVCESSGWYPPPEVLWREDGGKSLPRASEVKTQDKDGLFKVESVVVMTKESQRALSCHLRNPLTQQDEVSTIYLSESFFSTFSPWELMLSVLLFVWILLCLLFLGTFWKQNQAKKNILAELGWRRARGHAVRLTFDPETAHHELILSADLKVVTRGNTIQDVEDNNQRFSLMPAVLSKEMFSSGRHYWEADVGKWTWWVLGAAYESVKRKGGIKFNPNEGFWVLQLISGEYSALTSPEKTPLPVQERIQKVGVYLDFEKGQLTFYNADTMMLLYTFTDSFTQDIRPFFCLWGNGAQIQLCF
ncbi:butyrophilin subfamily 1 member A1-like [Lissotriton helveticus]